MFREITYSWSVLWVKMVRCLACCHFLPYTFWWKLNRSLPNCSFIAPTVLRVHVTNCLLNPVVHVTYFNIWSHIMGLFCPTLGLDSFLTVRLSLQTVPFEFGSSCHILRYLISHNGFIHPDIWDRFVPNCPFIFLTAHRVHVTYSV